MKLTVEQLLSRDNWLHHELIRSLSFEIIEKAKEDGFYDIKLLVNGVELEPDFYNDLVCNIEKYIDSEAKNLIKNELEKAESESRKLYEIIKAAKDSIIDKFDLYNESE